MTPQSNTSIKDQIRRCNDAFEDAFTRQDSAGIAKLYTSDALLLPPGAGEQKGTSAIQHFWQGAMEMGIAQARLTTHEADAYGDTAVETGRFVLSGTNGDPLDQGKYVVIWKQQSGQWLLHRDIWNSSNPPA